MNIGAKLEFLGRLSKIIFPCRPTERASPIGSKGSLKKIPLPPFLPEGCRVPRTTSSITPQSASCKSTRDSIGGKTYRTAAEGCSRHGDFHFKFQPLCISARVQSLQQTRCFRLQTEIFCGVSSGKKIDLLSSSRACESSKFAEW